MRRTTPSKEAIMDDGIKKLCRSVGIPELSGSSVAIKAAVDYIAELEKKLELATAAAMGCRVLVGRQITEKDIMAATSEARRLYPEILADNAIRAALMHQTDAYPHGGWNDDETRRG
jgi:hypothetical protein